MKNEKELQQKYLYGQLLKQQATALIEEKQAIEARLGEVVMTKEAINRIGGTAKGDVIWSPLGSGAFMISNVADTKSVLVNVGAGVLVKTNHDNALSILEGRMNELQEADTQITAELNRFAQQLGALESEMQQMVHEEERKKGMKDSHKHKHDDKVKGTGG